MIDLSTLNPMGQNTRFYSLATDGSGEADATPHAVGMPKWAEQNEGVLPMHEYGVGVEVAEKDILTNDIAWQFYVIALLEGNEDIPWKAEFPAISTNLDSPNKEVTLKILLRRGILELFNVIGQPEGAKAFHLSSQSAIPLTVNTEFGDKKSVILGEILERLDVIAQREDNWDGFESKKPLEVSLYRAKLLMEKLLNAAISEGYSWGKPSPFISSDEDGYITVEWQGDGRRLRLLIEEEEVEYTKLWRINTKRKVRTYSMRGDDCFEIWEWLING